MSRADYQQIPSNEEEPLVPSLRTPVISLRTLRVLVPCALVAAVCIVVLGVAAFGLAHAQSTTKDRPPSPSPSDTGTTELDVFELAEMSQAVAAVVSSLATESANQNCPVVGMDGLGCPVKSGPKMVVAEPSIARLPSVVGTGYDVTAHSVKLPVVKLTYASDPKTRAVTLPSGAKYTVPTEVDISVSKETTPQKSALLFADEAAFFKAKPAATAGAGSATNGMPARSPSASDLQKTDFVDGQKAALLSDIHTIATASFNAASTPSLQLDAFAKKAIDSLPDSYDPETYGQFIDLWGTHYITESKMGGIIEGVTVVKGCITTILNAAGVTAEARKDMDVKTKASSQGSMNKEFTSRRRFQYIGALGGNPELSDYPSRIKSFAENPAHAHVSFKPITDLITDPKRKSSMANAIEKYIADAQARVAADVSTAAKDRKAAFLKGQQVMAGYHDGGWTRKDCHHRWYGKKKCRTHSRAGVTEVSTRVTLAAPGKVNVKGGTCERSANGEVKAPGGAWVVDGCSESAAAPWDSGSNPSMKCCQGCTLQVAGSAFTCSCPSF